MKEITLHYFAMKKLIVVLLGLSFFITISCQEAIISSDERDSLKVLINNYNNALERKDFTQFVQYCTNDMEFYNSDGKIIPVNDLVKTFTIMFQPFEEPHTEVIELDMDVSENIACAKYKEVFKFKLQGSPHEMHNLITVSFRKDEGNWKISHLHMSTSMS